MDLTQVIRFIRFFREEESHRSEKSFPLSFFLFKVSIFKSPITNKLSYFNATQFREFESSLKNIYLLLLIGGL